MSMQSKSTICLFRSQHEMHSQAHKHGFNAMQCDVCVYYESDETLIKCTHIGCKKKKKKIEMEE